MHERRRTDSFLGFVLVFSLAVGFGGVRPVCAREGFLLPTHPPQAQYKIEVNLDLVNKVLSGTETIKFMNDTPRPMEVIALDWLPQAGSRAVEITEAGTPLHCMNQERGLPVSPPLFYALARPLKTGSELELHLRFTSKLPDGSSSVMSFVGNWNPKLWWENIPVRDAYKVKLDTPPGYVLAISGRLNEASGYYENENVTTSFGIYLANNLKAAEKKSGDVLITALFTKEGEECARFCLDKAVDIITFFRDSFGFFPRRFLYILPGASRPMGGYPFASGIVVIHGEEVFRTMPPLHWEWITSHEIGHQYWGEYVMSDDFPYGYTDSWLMIGMGICTDHEYVRHKKLGEENHQAFLNGYRAGVERRVDTTEDAPASLLKQQNYDRNNILIHGKGFSILSALESVLGKEMFAKILLETLKDYGGKRLGYRQFWKVCEDISGENLNWFFEPWVRSNNYLCYQIVSRDSAKKEDRYVSRVVVEASLDSIRMPVLVKAVFEDGTSQIKSTDRFLETNELTFESRSALKDVILDPEGQLAMLKSPLPTLPEDLPGLINRLPWQGAGKEALKAFELARSSQLKDANLWFSLGIKLVDGGSYAEAFESMRKITESGPAKELNFIALTWMGNLKDLMGQREKAIEYYQEALKYDPGETAIRHDQWGISINRQWIEDRLKTPFRLQKK
ncbi:MAG: M1 family aminopeptidase [Candidatus Aminicenantes bacterium]|nr:M1 family aminopeptidase [Candidatus Aminicenantes bacterium]